MYSRFANLFSQSSIMSNVATLPATSSPAVEARPNPPALQARSLTKRYGDVTALDMLDLSIWPGEVFCLLGANGAGKTTTINLFLGFTKPSAGSAHVNGRDVNEYPLETRRLVGYIPEQVALYASLTGLENLAYFTALATGRDVPEDELTRHLTDVGLPRDSVQRKVKEYSKGMRQKVAIAIARAKQTSALLLDEPTSGLDPKAANEFSALLALLASQGTAILMATHDLFRAKESGTRVGIMKHGRLVETLRTEDIGHADLEQLFLAHMKA